MRAAAGLPAGRVAHLDEEDSWFDGIDGFGRIFVGRCSQHGAMLLKRRLLDDRDSRSRVTGQMCRQLTGNWVDFRHDEA